MSTVPPGDNTDEGPPSGTLMSPSPQFVPQPHPHMPGGWGSGGLVGRTWNLLGNSTALMVFMFVFLASLYVATGFIKEDRAEYRRNIQNQFETQQRQFENQQRQIDHCMQAHQQRDQEATRDVQRQFEERQQQSRERERWASQVDKIADQSKAIDQSIKILSALVTKLDAKLKPPAKSDKPDTPDSPVIDPLGE